MTGEKVNQKDITLAGSYIAKTSETMCDSTLEGQLEKVYNPDKRMPTLGRLVAEKKKKKDTELPKDKEKSVFQSGITLSKVAEMEKQLQHVSTDSTKVEDDAASEAVKHKRAREQDKYVGSGVKSTGIDLRKVAAMERLLEKSHDEEDDKICPECGQNITEAGKCECDREEKFTQSDIVMLYKEARVVSGNKAPKTRAYLESRGLLSEGKLDESRRSTARETWKGHKLPISGRSSSKSLAQLKAEMELHQKSIKSR